MDGAAKEPTPAAPAEPRADREVDGSTPRAQTRVRRILHCDMDCFYAAIHIRDEPWLAGKPVLVGHSAEKGGVVVAASYEARRYGIRSATPSATARRLCPDAVFIPPDFRRYRAESEAVFAILGEMAARVQPVSIDEAYLDVSHSYREWGSATAVAEQVRRRIRRERRLTVSVGVGPNKLVAKIASDYRKPDGLTVVRPSRVEAFLAPLSVRALPGVGPATQKRLMGQGVRRIADLQAWSEEELLARFGRYGRSLYRFSRGEDDRPVRIHRGRKSLSHERTFAEDLASLEAIRPELVRLAERVASGLDRRDLVARTVSIKVRYSDFSTVSRSLSLQRPTAERSEIESCALELLRRTEAGRRRVRLLGVGSSGLEPVGLGQLLLFGSQRD